LGHRPGGELTFRRGARAAEPWPSPGFHAGRRSPERLPALLRTMELMLGLPPMNQMDATAIPTTACFTDLPGFTPFTALTNNILGRLD
jgi:hypothetical protein